MLIFWKKKKNKKNKNALVICQQRIIGLHNAFFFSFLFFNKYLPIM